jgi:hypothetical protein
MIPLEQVTLPTTPAPVDLTSVSHQLRALTDAVNKLASPPDASPVDPSPNLEDPSHNVPMDTVPCLLFTMTTDNIAQLLHHPGTSFPPICPCDTANASDTKTHWSAEELHRVMGCWKFHNYKHLLQISRDGKWVDGGEFPLLLGSYTTIPKAKRGSALDHTKYCYLDAVHMDIAFGDCVSIGGFCYVLILVDHVTRYNWSFGPQRSHLCQYCLGVTPLQGICRLSCKMLLLGLRPQIVWFGSKQISH